jgi:hypothetical protein
MYLNSPLIFYPDTNVSLTATLMQKLFQVWLNYSLTSCCQVAIIYKASEQVCNQMFYNPEELLKLIIL